MIIPLLMTRYIQNVETGHLPYLSLFLFFILPVRKVTNGKHWNKFLWL